MKLVILLLTLFFQDPGSSGRTAGERLQEKAMDKIAKSDFDSAYYYFELAKDSYKSVNNWDGYFESEYRQGRIYLRRGEFEKVLEKAEEIRLICDTLFEGPNLQIAHSYELIGLNAYYESDYDKTFENLRRSTGIKQEFLPEDDLALASSYNYLGIAFDEVGAFDSSLHYYNKSLEIRVNKLGDTVKLVADLYNNMGVLHKHMGFYEEGLRKLTKSLEIRKKVLGPIHPDVGTSYNNLGAFYVDLGAYNLAHEYYLQDLKVSTETLGPDNWEVALTHQNISQVYTYQGKYEEAIESLNTALTIYRKTFKKENIYTAVPYINLGTNYNQLGNFEKSLEYLKKASAVLIEIEDDVDLARNYQHLGSTYMNMGKHDIAEMNFKKSIEVNTRVYGTFHPYLAESYNYLGRLYTKLERFEDAQKAFEEAIKANSFDSAVPNDSISTQMTSNYLQLLDSWLLLAENHYKYFLKEGDPKQLDMSLEYVTRCDQLVEEIRRVTISFEDRIFLSQKFKEIYDLGIQLVQEQSNRNSMELLFYFMEKSKSRSLVEALNKLGAQSFAGIPEYLVQLENSLKSQIAYNRSNLITAIILGEKNLRNELESTLFYQNRSYDSLLLVFQRSYPEYFAFKYGDDVVSTKNVQSYLEDNEALIEYFIGKSSGKVVLITKNEMIKRSIEIDSLGEVVKNFRDMVSKPEMDRSGLNSDISKAGWEIYNSLFGDMLNDRENIQKLIIVPDKELHYLPFELLVTSEADPDDQEDFKSFDYVMMDYQIRYANSATWLINRSKHNRNPNHKKVVAFAPDFTANETKQLNWNMEEVEEISSQWPSTLYKSGFASEMVFKSEAIDYDIIHLATHAEVDNERPFHSRFILGSNEIEDGFLYTAELLNLQLNSSLAVLSACETGSGKLAEGEGMMSLANAFSYAGCPSVVMSLWSVDDKSTSELMGDLYKYLGEGLEKDEALRQAKLEFLENSQGLRTHPYYWAGFIALGNNDPISKGYSLWLYLVVSLGVILIIIGYMRYRERLQL